MSPIQRQWEASHSIMSEYAGTYACIYMGTHVCIYADNIRGYRCVYIHGYLCIHVCIYAGAYAYSQWAKDLKTQMI